MTEGATLDDYIDLRRLHLSYEEKECWNCGNTWFREARPAESICSNCLWGQGDHKDVDEPTDYGELWYGDISREEMKREYKQTQKKMSVSHVEVRIDADN